MGFKLLGNTREICMGNIERVAFGRDVAIVEAIEVDLALIEELKKYRDAVKRIIE
jgi:hypothetical protein